MADEDSDSLFKSLLIENHGSVLKVARAYTLTTEDCQDLVQEILLQVWRSLPLAISILAFLSQVAWQVWSGGWLPALAVAGVVVMGVIILAGVYRLNQDAVRTELVPRRQELEALLTSLKDETLAVSENSTE